MQMNKGKSLSQREELPLKVVKDELYSILADKELKFGCKWENEYYEYLYVGYNEISRTFLSITIDDGSEFYADKKQIKNETIIGTEPTLNDLLLKLGENLEPTYILGGEEVVLYSIAMMSLCC